MDANLWDMQMRVKDFKQRDGRLQRDIWKWESSMQQRNSFQDFTFGIQLFTIVLIIICELATFFLQQIIKNNMHKLHKLHRSFEIPWVKFLDVLRLFCLCTGLTSAITIRPWLQDLHAWVQQAKRRPNENQEAEKQQAARWCKAAAHVKKGKLNEEES